MTIHTRIQGDPAGVEALGIWLTGRFNPALDDAATSISGAMRKASGGWSGQASQAFQSQMGSRGKDVQGMADDVHGFGRSVTQFAETLRHAQGRMGEARDIAAAAGLSMTADTIEYPGAGPGNPGILTGEGVTAAEVSAHNSAVAAHEAHVRKLEAYDQSKSVAEAAWIEYDDAVAVAKKFWDEIAGKWHLNAADFTNGVVGGYVAAHRSVLRKQAAFLREMAEKHNRHYLHSPGGSPQAKYNEAMRAKNLADADLIDRRLGSLSRNLLSKTPVIGGLITAAGVGYDIHQGKPPGKAIFSGVAGMGGAALAGMLVTGPVGWTALAAVGAGVGAGMLADHAWDHWVPEGAKDAINEGLEDVGGAIGDAWDSVF